MDQTTREKIDFLLSKMNSEGFDYCFTSYSDWKEIESKSFHQLRRKYIKAKAGLEKYINKLNEEIK